MSKPREWWIDLTHSCQMGDCFAFDNKAEADKWLTEQIHVIEKTPHVSKCIALHDEMLAVLKSTLESLLPYDKEGKMSAVVIAVCDVIKKAEAP